MIATIDDGEAGSVPTSELALLKMDVRGRVRVPAAKREAILDAFEASGMSGAAFAKQWNLKYPTFANWVQRRRRNRPKILDTVTPGTPKSISLVEAVMEQESPGERGLTVEAPGGIKLWVRRREEVALAVELLKSLPSC